MSDDARSPISSTDDGDDRRTQTRWAAPVAAWSFAFVLLRIFAVADYQWETAFKVSTTLSISDSVSLVFGSLMGGHVLVEVLVVILLPLVLTDFLWVRTGHRPSVALMVIVGTIILCALTFSFRNWWLPASAGAVFGVFAFIHVLPADFPLRRGLAVVTARTGQVLEVEPGYLDVLTDDREFRIIPSTDVVNRE